MDFLTFLYKTAPKTLPPKCLIALDPGETTGWALFTNGSLEAFGQLPTHTVAQSVALLTDLFQEHLPNTVVYEDYRIYAWKAQSHSWETLHTPRLIGCIQTLVTQQSIQVCAQMAQQPKVFCTNDKLKMWGLYKPGVKHALDAIRHGTYYMLFNHKKYTSVSTENTTQAL